MLSKQNYFVRVSVTISQVLNVVVFNGYPDEMLSARAYRCRDSKFWSSMAVVLDTCFFWQTDHCYQTYLWELERKDNAAEYWQKYSD